MTRLPRLVARSLSIADGTEGDRVTTLELFFDLVFVFAFTQVTTLMAHVGAPGSFVDGFILLSLLWWSWCSFSWLGNQAHADEGILRGAFVVAMVATFIGCLALPDAFGAAPKGLPGPAVVVACYIVVRLTHTSTYLLAARDDLSLRRQVLETLLGSLIPTATLLILGVAAGHDRQRTIWFVAVLYDFAAVFVSAVRSRGWVVSSAAHFAERYGLVVILALGESIVDIAVGRGRGPLTWHVVVGGVLAMLTAVGLWFAYFPRLLGGLEEALEHARGQARARLAEDIFTYLHFPVIAGIIVTALGLESAMAHLGAHRLGVTGGYSLGCGVALFLLATVACGLRACRVWLVPRLVGALLLVAGSPILARLPSLGAVGVTAAALLTLAVIDSGAGQ